MQIKDLIPWARKDETPAGKEAESNPLASLQRDMTRAFEDFYKRMESATGSLSGSWFPATARSDMVETDGAIEVSIELPGMSQEDIDVSLTDDALTIKGEKRIERKDEKKGYYVSERSYGSVFRTIPLPPGVDTEKAEASFKNGVLTIRLPQTAEAKAKVKRIEVKAA